MKVALITGAARGLGRAIGEELGADHQIAFTWHSAPPDATLSRLPDALAMQTDLTDADAVAALPERIIAAFGRLDVIVNNAASLAPDSATDYNADRAAQIYALNVSAPMGVVAAALDHLKPGAAIVNITSTNARLPAMAAQSYSASKAALETWTRIAAKTLGARGIRVNAVAPGAVNIPEAPRPPELTAAFVKDTALGALAEPEDIAAAVRFLASDAARAVTGHVLDVNGGYRL